MNEYIVKALNNEGKLTISRRHNRQWCEQFAEKIWETNTFSPIKYVAVENIDGMIICEYEN